MTVLRSFRVGFAALVMGMAWGAAWAADPLAYSVRISPTPGLDAALAASSQLLALRTKAPAGPFALVARSRDDIARIKTALDSYGYYAANVSVRIDGRALDDPDLADALEHLPDGASVKIELNVDKGPLFRLRNVVLDGSIPADARAKFALAPGQPAVAADVLGAGATLLNALREDGYAMAQVDAPVATEIPAAHALDVSFHAVSGPRVDLGNISFSGLGHVHERFVRRRLLLHAGDQFRPSAVEAARQDLAGIGVFSSVQISAAKGLAPDGTLPLAIKVTERARHAVSLDAAFSTDLGGTLGATWSHRNLFGNAEQLNLTASATGLGGSASKGLGYLAHAQLIKPDFYARDQSIEFDLSALKQNLQAYDQTALIAETILTRKLSARWTVSAGLMATQEQIIQEGATRDYTLVALPITGRFDGTGLANPLDDATHGVRLLLSATPTESLSAKSGTFVILQATASTYFDFSRFGFSKPGKSVLAVRGLVGSAQGASAFDLPPDQRFYGGGSATVRGYKYQSIGPLFADYSPMGGAAIDAATIEFRQRVWGSVGAVVFADAGQVTNSSAPFAGKLQAGYGVGVRYYTPIGPVRLDVALPATRPPNGDSFELYLGLGQAF